MSQNPPTCGQIMGNHMVRVQAAEDLLAAVSRMNETKASSAMVEESGKLVGLITERDIVKFVETSRRPSEVSVKEIMSPPPVMVSENTSVEEAVQLMLDLGDRRLSVFRDDALVGMVTSTNILAAISKGLLAREVFIYLSDVFKKEASPAT